MAVPVKKNDDHHQNNEEPCVPSRWTVTSLLCIFRQKPVRLPWALVADSAAVAVSEISCQHFKETPWDYAIVVYNAEAVSVVS